MRWRNGKPHGPTCRRETGRFTIAREFRPDFIQLHFKETLADTSLIVRELRPLGIHVIKTLPLSSSERIEQFGEDDVEHCVKKLCEASVYGILVDSIGPSNAVETGVIC